MKKQNLFFILGVILLSLTFVSSAGDYNTYYKLNLDYNKGNINVSSVGIEFFQGGENYFGFYTAKIIDYNNKILNLSFFDVPNEILVDNVDSKTGEISGGGLRILDKVSFEIYLPYYENAKEIIIYNENMTELARVNVGNEYSKERAGEIISEKEVAKEEIGKEKETEIKTGTEKETFISGLEKYSNYWWVLVIVLIVLLIILFFSFRKKKK